MARDTRDTRPLGELPAEGFVRQAQLIPAPVPFSNSTLWRQIRAGTFPAPVKLSEGITAWRVEDVRQWLDAQARLAPAGPTKRKGRAAATADSA